MIYGATALTVDGGATWSASSLSHLDFGATDWSTPAATTMIAIKHESGDEAVLIKDAGKTWTSLGKGFKQAGASWSVVAPLPPGYTIGFTGPNFGWDAQRGIIDASTMGKAALRFVR